VASLSLRYPWNSTGHVQLGDLGEINAGAVSRALCEVLLSVLMFRVFAQVVLEAGDMPEVPAGVVHYARVVGAEPVTFVDASKY
jgi:hypothetical protein